MTQTTSANWTAINAGSTTGQTLGSAGTTTYYYANSNLSFTNSTAGGSGLTIQGTVYVYVPSGVTLTCTGANANGITGAGAGIELASGNTLYLLGTGTVTATGGSAGTAGTPGIAGTSHLHYYYTWDNRMACGGGGGAKGSCNEKADGYYEITSGGVNGGQNGDGTYAPNGGSTGVSPDWITAGMVTTNDNLSY